MTTTGDQPAYPSEQHETQDGTWNQTYDSGMSYRQWLIGQIASGHMESIDSAGWVIRAADAVIARLDKERGER